LLAAHYDHQKGASKRVGEAVELDRDGDGIACEPEKTKRR